METNDTQVLLTFLVITVPLVLFWLWLFLLFRHKIKTALNYFVFASFAMGLAFIYYLTLFFASDLLLNGNMKHLVNATCFGLIMWVCNIVIPIAIITLILTVIWAYKTRALNRKEET